MQPDDTLLLGLNCPFDFAQGDSSRIRGAQFRAMLFVEKVATRA